MDAGHPFVPVAGESENGFRKLIAEHSDEGLKGISIGQSPGLVAISMKAAISALEGNPMPQLISVPLPVADHTDAEGRRELLVGPARQLLHRQRVPALRREHLRPRDHGADRGRHVTTSGGGPAPGRRTSAMAERPTPHVQLTGVSKHFAGVRALEGVDFACRRGIDPRRPRRERRRQVDADQDHRRRAAPRRRRDAPRRPRRSPSPTPSEATRAGIVCIFQELSLIPDLTVADNISLADPPRRLGLIDRARPAPPRRGAARPHRAARTSTRARWSATSACRAGRWSRSPRRSAATPRS